MRIAEPDVTLSDFALSLENMVLAALSTTLPATARPVQGLFLIFFLALTVASVCGGAVHGFFTDPRSRAHDNVWRASLLALGTAALSLWGITAWVALQGPWSEVLVVGAILLYLVYVFVIVFVRHEYRVAIVHYAPALVALAATFFWRWLLHASLQLLIGVAGVALALAAGMMQQKRIAIHPRYFSHNALYHLNQAVALCGIYVGARALMLGA